MIAPPEIARLGDWEATLASYVADCRDRPFVWGEHDCALFVSGAVKVMTGFDPAAAYRGKYASAAGSVRALRKFGPGTLEGQFDTFFERIAPAFAQRGDIALHAPLKQQGGRSNETGAVGLVMGDFALFVGQEGEAEGLIRVPRADWAAVWAVGHPASNGAEAGQRDD